MSKKVKYNKEEKTKTGLIVYEIEMSEGEKGYSTFGISEENIKKIAPQLLKENKKMIEITDKEFNDLFSAHRNERYRNINIENRYGEKIKVQIDKGTKKEVLKEIIEAYQNSQPIYIENKKGYAEFPFEDEEETAIYSENGEAHIYYVGLTTGKIKSFIQLNDKNAMGGSILSTSPIKKAKTNSEERILYKMIENYNKEQNHKELKEKNKIKKSKNFR